MIDALEGIKIKMKGRDWENLAVRVRTALSSARREWEESIVRPRIDTHKIQNLSLQRGRTGAPLFLLAGRETDYKSSNNNNTLPEQ
jgi:hypothetical protein